MHYKLVTLAVCKFYITGKHQSGLYLKLKGCWFETCTIYGSRGGIGILMKTGNCSNMTEYLLSGT